MKGAPNEKQVDLDLDEFKYTSAVTRTCDLAILILAVSDIDKKNQRETRKHYYSVANLKAKTMKKTDRQAIF